MGAPLGRSLCRLHTCWSQSVRPFSCVPRFGWLGAVLLFLDYALGCAALIVKEILLQKMRRVYLEQQNEPLSFRWYRRWIGF
jgi:hypothetical protein